LLCVQFDYPNVCVRMRTIIFGCGDVLLYFHIVA
jgi:hypothetical protein